MSATPVPWDLCTNNTCGRDESSPDNFQFSPNHAAETDDIYQFSSWSNHVSASVQQLKEQQQHILCNVVLCHSASPALQLRRPCVCQLLCDLLPSNGGGGGVKNPFGLIVMGKAKLMVKWHPGVASGSSLLGTNPARRDDGVCLSMRPRCVWYTTL